MSIGKQAILNPKVISTKPPKTGRVVNTYFSVNFPYGLNFEIKWHNCEIGIYPMDFVTANYKVIYDG